MNLVELKNVSKHYQLGKTTIKALKGVDLTIQEGDFVSIVGPSGCGKTTMLNIIGCIDTPTSGEIFLDGTNVATLSDNQEADTRLTKIGFIFQSFNLVPVLNIRENIELPLILKGASKEERKEQVERLVELVGLSEFITHKPDELSGGQRQRVAIARALVNRPKLVIADEPTANLDSETGAGIIEAMQKLNRDEKVTFLFSTHNPMVVDYAHKVVNLKDGLITGIEKGGSRQNKRSNGNESG